MDLERHSVLLVVFSAILGVISIAALDGYYLALSLFLICLIAAVSLHLRQRILYHYWEIIDALESLANGSHERRLDPDAGPGPWTRLAGEFNKVLDSLAVSKELDAGRLADAESKMQQKTRELLGKTAQLEKTLLLQQEEINRYTTKIKELQASEERFRRMTQSAPIGIFLVNEHGVTTYVNPALKSIFELEGDWDLERSQQGALPPLEAISTVESWLQGVLEGEEYSHETQIWTNRGAMRWISFGATRILDQAGNVLGYVGAVEDITALKLTEQALRESELRYREVVENANEGIVVVQNNYPAFWNKQVSELYGYSREEFKGWDFDSHIHPDDRRKVLQKQHELVESGKRTAVQAFRIISRDGNERWVEQSSIKIIWDSAPALLCFQSDVSERKKAEEALQRAHDALEMEVAGRTSELLAANYKLTNEIEERKRGEAALLEHEKLLRATIESTADGILVVDENGRITHFNNLFKKIFRIPISLMAARDNAKILDHMAGQIENSHNFKQTVYETFKTAQTTHGALVLKDGRVIEEYSSPLSRHKPDGGRVWSFRDVTATKELESQLIRSERLAATGQLAASVAHEINSPLQAITMMLGAIKREYADDRELCSRIDLLKGAFLNIRDTVKNLLDLNRPGKEKRQKTNINRIIEGSVGLGASYLKKSRVEVILDLDESIPDILASPQQMSQVVLNLVNNAVEAVSANADDAGPGLKGCIVVKTLRRNSSLVMQVMDDGPGIAPEDLNNVFDPFYTRKKKMGMGVGLSICLGIIEEHRGSISVANNAEGGAIFTITLPIEDPQSQNPAPYPL
ncbi:PAS domain S-box-containing protein [Desulfatibacillum alkenivorans DSM 16219]|jgi:PAS domain S-box-containing protein|uniref:histidine kinase n=1 Tax=Desulfatibacillum alkenivorans DSM 16219 TaxID=1121393 RepID=A0A1M6GD41_9BACT|nr:PAS domain S-box protein [Desulfatibacillum alkenivorans]SHJ07863.1 PAS domain S-box-containing protein [Desulfatibacillum alkenivorans DSM 16219]